VAEGEPAPEDAGDGGARQVVRGRAEPAGADDGAGAVEGLADRPDYVLLVVAHRRPASHADAELAETPGQPRGVGVDDVAQEELVSDGEELDGGHPLAHAASLTMARQLQR